MLVCQARAAKSKMDPPPARPEAVPGAVLVELEAWRVIVVKRAVDLAGAVRRDTGDHAHVLRGRDREKQPVDFRSSGSPASVPHRVVVPAGRRARRRVGRRRIGATGRVRSARLAPAASACDSTTPAASKSARRQLRRGRRRVRARGAGWFAPAPEPSSARTGRSTHARGRGCRT